VNPDKEEKKKKNTYKQRNGVNLLSPPNKAGNAFC